MGGGSEEDFSAMIPVWLMCLLVAIDLVVAVAFAYQRKWWFVLYWVSASSLTFSLIGMAISGKTR